MKSRKLAIVIEKVQCTGNKLSGLPCRNKAMDQGFCLVHHPQAQELRSDSGKYAGHGDDFKKRAKQLGVLRAIEVAQCPSGDQRTFGRQYQAPPARLSTMNEREIADDFERVLGECQSQRQLLQGLMSERRLLIRDRSNLKTEFCDFVARLPDLSYSSPVVPAKLELA